MMAKDNQSLSQSRQIRNMLLGKWGRIPNSIFRVNWSKSTNIDLSERSYAAHKKETSYANTPFALSSIGARHGDLSRFPQDLGSFLVNFLCAESGVVIDPFAGHNSRLELVYRAGRSYIGLDVSAEFMRGNYKIRDMLYHENSMSMMPSPASITLIEADSREMLKYVPKNTADFLITSPPFYDIEDYGNEPEQLGRAKTYRDFLYALQVVFGNCYSVLKPGAFAAIEVNDFRRDGIFHPYHADAIERLRNVGFIIHDIIIVDYGTGFLQAFASDIEHHHIVCKVHSYIIVARKKFVAGSQTRAETRTKLITQLSADVVGQGGFDVVAKEW